MPLIHFRCKACGEGFDAFRRLSDGGAAGPPCPNCGGGDAVFPEESSEEAPCAMTPGAGTVR